MKTSSDWQKETTPILKNAILLYGVGTIACIFFPLPIRLRLIALPIVYVALTIVLFSSYAGKVSNSWSKVFPAPLEKSSDVVATLLKSKQIPFTQKDKRHQTIFTVDLDEVELQILIKQHHQQNLITSQIILFPITIYNKPFVQSFAEKLDNVFAT